MEIDNGVDFSNSELPPERTDRLHLDWWESSKSTRRSFVTMKLRPLSLLRAVASQPLNESDRTDRHLEDVVNGVPAQTRRTSDRDFLLSPGVHLPCNSFCRCRKLCSWPSKA